MFEKYEERRKLNVIIQQPGGTAKPGSQTYKLALPSRWIKAMKLSRDMKELVATFDGEKITLLPLIPLDEFIRQKVRKGNRIKFYRCYNDTRLCTEFCADLTDKEIRVVNFTDKKSERAFGAVDVLTWAQYISFLKYRTEFSLWNGKSEKELIEVADNCGGRRADDSFWFSAAYYGE